MSGVGGDEMMTDSDMESGYMTPMPEVQQASL